LAFNKTNSRHVSLEQQSVNPGSIVTIFPSPPVEDTPLRRALSLIRSGGDSKSPAGEGKGAIVAEGAFTEDDWANGKLLTEFLVRNMRRSMAEPKVAFLFGLHRRIGTWSPVYRSFALSPICELNLVRLIFGYAFDE